MLVHAASVTTMLSIGAMGLAPPEITESAKVGLLLLGLAALALGVLVLPAAARRKVDAIDSLRRESLTIRSKALAWLAEKKAFRAMEVDATAWEDWLDRGALIAGELLICTRRLQEEGADFVEQGETSKVADILRALELHVRGDLQAYESARAVVAMQSGAGNSKRLN